MRTHLLVSLFFFFFTDFTNLLLYKMKRLQIWILKTAARNLLCPLTFFHFFPSSSVFAPLIIYSPVQTAVSVAAAARQSKHTHSPMKKMGDDIFAPSLSYFTLTVAWACNHHLGIELIWKLHIKIFSFNHFTLCTHKLSLMVQVFSNLRTCTRSSNQTESTV